MNKMQASYPSIDKPWLRYYNKNYSGLPTADMSIFDFLCTNTQGRSKNIALNYYGKKITYGDLIKKIDDVASSLLAYGVKRGDIVTLCALNTPEFVYLLYALNKIGAISNWIGLTSPVEDLHEQIVSTGSKIVFAINIAYAQIQESIHDDSVQIIIIPIENSMPKHMKMVVGIKGRQVYDNVILWKDFLKTPYKIPVLLQNVKPDDIAVIEYTGGSTGVPKGVMLSNKALNTHYVNFYITNYNGIFAFEAKDRLISGVPFFLVFGMCACCHSPLCHSMELVLAPDPSPAAGTKIIIKNKINHVMAGRLLIENLLEAVKKSKSDLSYVKSVMYGGEETNKSWENMVRSGLEAFGMNAPLLNSYGMSETSAGVLTAPDNSTDGLIPCANIEVKIVNPDDCHEEYGYDKEGELCISTNQLMTGYYNNPKETNDVIFEDAGLRWIKTHDLATISSDGIIRITGRIKRIYSRLTADKIQVRVYPMRIEETLIKNDLVQECAVVGVKDDILAYRTVAFIIPSGICEIQKDMVRQLGSHCREMLPESHIPDDYVFIKEFPTTRAGKVDYRALERSAKKS